MRLPLSLPLPASPNRRRCNCSPGAAKRHVRNETPLFPPVTTFLEATLDGGMKDGHFPAALPCSDP